MLDGSDVDGDGVARDLRENLCERVMQIGTAASVFPVRTVKAIVESAAWCRDPDFLQWRLAINHHRDAVLKKHVEHIGFSSGVDVNVKHLVPVVGLCFNRIKDLSDPFVKFGFRHYFVLLLSGAACGQR